MDAAYLSALAALAGSVIGGFTSLTASWLTQRVQVSAQQLAHDLSRREDLYNEFIDETSNAFADALEHNEADKAKLVRLYALVSRMRVLSSERVIEQADTVMRRIIETYGSPNRSILDAAESIREAGFDPLRDFGYACRAERQVGAGASLR